MCARTTLSKKDLREVAEELEAEFSEEDAHVYRPRYNVAPSDTLWILRHGADRRVAGPPVWGYRAKNRPLINVRRENVGAGSFREPFASRRCGVVVDGLYEWNAGHEPTWFHRADGGLRGCRTRRSRPRNLPPAFDEYLIAYRDRDAVLPPAVARRINAGGGLLAPIIVVGGRMVGVWRRTVDERARGRSRWRRSRLPTRARAALGELAERYAAFLQLAPNVVWRR